jgi:nitrogen fixation/metabolism regulation signal transduction histidine kinase
MLIKADDLGLLILLLVLSAVVGIAFAVALARALTARISQLATAAQRVGSGDLQVRVPAESQDELGGLGRVLNGMAERLQAAARAGGVAPCPAGRYLPRPAHPTGHD